MIEISEYQKSTVQTPALVDPRLMKSMCQQPAFQQNICQQTMFRQPAPQPGMCQQIKDSAPKYSLSLIIPRSDAQTLRAIRAAVDEAIENGIANKWGGKRPPNLKLPLRDGDVDREEDEAYSDAYFVNATSLVKPGVVDRNRVPLTNPLAIYSGCYVRASINFYPFNAKGNRGVAAGLGNVQFWCDGEPLTSRVRAEDEFDALDDEDDDDFLD